MKKYINIKTQSGVETIDEFSYNTKEEKQEALKCFKEYKLSYKGSGIYPYLSSRCDKSWDQ
jgi:hypothetical protein